MTRPRDDRRYVWRLDVEYPVDEDGVRLPPGCTCSEFDPEHTMAEHMAYCAARYGWPLVRDYLSAGGAARRAQLLRDAGATVYVVRSHPVQFPVA
jgi:hypothetical protein